jgi:hypothetical protein
MKKVFLIVSIMFVTYAVAEYRTNIFTKYNLSIGNGKTVWITVDIIDNYGKCFEMSMGGDAHGGASNCSTDIDGYWSYHGCGSSVQSAKGGITTIANKILEECSN